MNWHISYFRYAITAFATALAAAQVQAMPAASIWYEILSQPEGDAWIEAETQILMAWEETGSEALNMIQMRGEAALDEGDYLTAIGHLTALVDHAPDHAMGYQLRGMAYWMNGDYGPAAADLAQSLELEPKQYLALTQLGSMLEELGDNECAADALHRSLEINPHQQDVTDALDRLDAADNGIDI
ncbi:MAG: tetratricopeptide repeat protein [Paracoccus sp. (in: a-proteobacteria)]